MLHRHWLDWPGQRKDGEVRSCGGIIWISVSSVASSVLRASQDSDSEQRLGLFQIWLFLLSDKTIGIFSLLIYNYYPVLIWNCGFLVNSRGWCFLLDSSQHKSEHHFAISRAEISISLLTEVNLRYHSQIICINYIYYARKWACTHQIYNICSAINFACSH